MEWPVSCQSNHRVHPHSVVPTFFLASPWKLCHKFEMPHGKRRLVGGGSADFLFFFFLRPRVGSAATTKLNENRNKLQKFTKIGSARDETLYNSQKRAMETFWIEKLKIMNGTHTHAHTNPKHTDSARTHTKAAKSGWQKHSEKLWPTRWY